MNPATALPPHKNSHPLLLCHPEGSLPIILCAEVHRGVFEVQSSEVTQDVIGALETKNQSELDCSLFYTCTVW